MRNRRIRLLPLVGLALIVAPADAGNQERLVDTRSPISSITSAELVDDLPTIHRDFRLALAQAKPFDGLVVDTGRKFTNESQPHVTPPDWSCEPRRGSWQCSGPAIPAGRRSYFSWSSASDAPISANLGLELSYRGQRTFRDRLQVSFQHGYEVKSDLKGLLNLPGGVAPGTRFMVSPANDDYRDGTWSFRSGGESLPAIDPSTLHWTPRFSTRAPRLDRLYYDLPANPAVGADYSFTYDNPWGDRTVDAAVPDWFYGGPCSPAGLQACQERVAAGSSVCICGCFPNMLDVDLTLDGKPIPFPTAMSSSLIRLPLNDVAPGTHVVAWGSKGQSQQFEVVSLSGHIGDNELQLGQPTTLTFQLAGSRSHLPLEIALNSAPASANAPTSPGGQGQDVLILEGGNKQTAYFDGSDPNMIRRGVLANAIGKFSINYTLELPPCPCGGWEGIRSLRKSQIRHPMSARASADAYTPGGDFSTRFDFSSNSIVALAPKPPFDPTQPLQIDLAQLGLTGSTPNLGDFRFEQRADMPSTARVSNFRVGSGGGLLSGDAFFQLHTDFTVPYSDDLPLQPGSSYNFNLQNLRLTGESQGLGHIRLEQDPGRPSSIRFNHLRKDYSGTLLYGNADFSLYAQIHMNF